MPLYLPRERIAASEQAASAARTSTLVSDIERQKQEAEAPPQPQYALPSLSSLTGGGQSTVMQAVGALPNFGQQAAQKAQDTLSWALPDLSSLGVTPEPPAAMPTPQTMLPQPEQTMNGTPITAPAGSGGPSVSSGVTNYQQPPVGASPQAGGDLRAYARQVAQQYGLDPDIFDRQINQESGYNPSARSPVGAAGIAQFMPGTAAQYGVNVDDPYSSLDGAARHMRDLLKANHGDYRLALAAYNAGQGNVDKYGEGVFGDDFANGQTRDYVNIILGPGTASSGRQSLNAGAALPSAPAASPSTVGAGVPSAPAPTVHPAVARKWEAQFGRPPRPDEAAELQQAMSMMGVM